MKNAASTIAILGIVFLIAYYCQSEYFTLPTPKSKDVPDSQFSEGRAHSLWIEMSKFHDKPIGHPNKQKFLKWADIILEDLRISFSDFQKNLLDKLQINFENPKRTTLFNMEKHFVPSSGCSHSDVKNVKRILVKFHDLVNIYGILTYSAIEQSEADERRMEKNAVLISSHYDSEMNTTGSHDDALPNAAQFELLRNLLDDLKQCMISKLSKLKGAKLDEKTVATIQKSCMNHEIMFLWNDGEEVGLLGSAALTKNPYERNKFFKRVGVALNLEASGFGGVPLIFRNTDAWITEKVARTLKSSVKINSVTQDVFDSGAIPSLSDYSNWIGDYLPADGSIPSEEKSFEEFQKRIHQGLSKKLPKKRNYFISAYDSAYYKNNYVYHTPLDDVQHYTPGTFQNAGDNVLSLLRHLTKLETNFPAHDKLMILRKYQGKLSPSEVDEKVDYEALFKFDERAIYFDIATKYVFVFTMSSVRKFSYVMVTICFILIFSVISAKLSKHGKSFKGIIQFLQKFLFNVAVLVIFLLSSVLVPIAIQHFIIAQAMHKPLRWYGAPIGQTFGIIFSFAALGGFGSIALIKYSLSLAGKKNVDELFSSNLQIVILNALFMVLTLFGAKKEIFSLHLFLLPLVSTAGLLVHKILSKKQSQKFVAFFMPSKSLHNYFNTTINVVFKIFPSFFTAFMLFDIAILAGLIFTATTGRSGETSKPDLMISGMLSFISMFSLLIFLPNFFERVSKGEKKEQTGKECAIFKQQWVLLPFLFVLTAIGFGIHAFVLFPYDELAHKRLFLQDVTQFAANKVDISQLQENQELNVSLTKVRKIDERFATLLGFDATKLEFTLGHPTIKKAFEEKQISFKFDEKFISPYPNKKDRPRFGAYGHRLKENAKEFNPKEEISSRIKITRKENNVYNFEVSQDFGKDNTHFQSLIIKIPDSQIKLESWSVPDFPLSPNIPLKMTPGYKMYQIDFFNSYESGQTMSLEFTLSLQNASEQPKGSNQFNIYLATFDSKWETVSQEMIDIFNIIRQEKWNFPLMSTLTVQPFEISF